MNQTERLLALKSRFQVSESESTYLLNNVLKVYPDRMKWIRFKTPREVKKPGLEGQGLAQQVSLKQLSVEEMVERKERSMANSISRSRVRVKDLVACNEWDYFWTLTFDPAKYPAEDDEKRRSKLTKWIWYQTRKYGKFEYLAVPERHKSGALHFHLLVNGYRGPLGDSLYPASAKRAGQRVMRGGRPVSFIKDWAKVGFSVADPVGDRDRLASYVTKYITKDLDKGDHEENRRRYWHSAGLNTPVVHHNVNRAVIDLLGGDVENRGTPFINEHGLFQDYPLKGGKWQPRTDEPTDKKRFRFE